MVKQDRRQAQMETLVLAALAEALPAQHREPERLMDMANRIGSNSPASWSLAEWCTPPQRLWKRLPTHLLLLNKEKEIESLLLRVMAQVSENERHQALDASFSWIGAKEQEEKRRIAEMCLKDSLTPLLALSSRWHGWGEYFQLLQRSSFMAQDHMLAGLRNSQAAWLGLQLPETEHIRQWARI